MIWLRRATDGRELRISFGLATPDRWTVRIEGDEREYRSPYLRVAIAAATDDEARAPWIIALEDQIRAHLRSSRNLDIPSQEMQGYRVFTGDEKKIGRVTGTSGDFVIIQHGHLQRSRRAVPRELIRVDDEKREVRLTVSKAIVLEGPVAGKAGEFDDQEISAHYGPSIGPSNSPLDQDKRLTNAPPRTRASGAARLAPGRLEIMGLAICSIVAVADSLSGHGIVLIGLLTVGPWCAMFAGRWTWTAITGLWAAGLAVPLGLTDGIWDSDTHFAWLAAVAAVALLTTLTARYQRGPSIC